MFGDRPFGRIRKSEFIVFSSTLREKKERTRNWDQNLQKAYEKGKTFFTDEEAIFTLEDRFFTVVENSDSGEVSDKTIFSYHQKDNTDGEEGTSIIEEI